MRDLFFATMQSLRAHALRFGLTSLGIVWGALMLTFLSSLVGGAERHYTKASQVMGDKIVMGGGGTILKPRVGERGARPVEFEETDLDAIERLDVVEHASPMIQLQNQIIRARGRTKLLTVQAVNQHARSIRGFGVAQGRFLSKLDVDQNARVAFLGADAAERLFGRTPSLGQFIHIGELRLRVVGVADAKGPQTSYTYSPDDLIVFIPYTTAQRWFKQSDKFSEFILSPHTLWQSDAAIQGSRERLALQQDFSPDSDSALWTWGVAQEIRKVTVLFGAIRVFFAAASLMTLLVGAIGVMNIMLVVAAERRSEIGLRKAVGGTTRGIFALFLAEASAVCILSAGLGAGLGILAAQLTARAMPDTPIASAPVLDPFMIVSILAALIVIGIIAGLVPAIRAARVPPAEALRA